MKIKVLYIKHDKNFKMRACKICGRKFFAYSNAKTICSDECHRVYNTQFCRAKLDRIKNDPQAMYAHRKSVIDKREAERKAKIRNDLPIIKKALAKGDEYLVDFLFDNYGRIAKQRKYRKEKNV